MIIHSVSVSDRWDFTTIFQSSKLEIDQTKAPNVIISVVLVFTSKAIDIWVVSRNGAAYPWRRSIYFINCRTFWLLGTFKKNGNFVLAYVVLINAIGWSYFLLIKPKSNNNLFFRSAINYNRGKGLNCRQFDSFCFDQLPLPGLWIELIYIARGLIIGL